MMRVKTKKGGPSLQNGIQSHEVTMEPAGEAYLVGVVDGGAYFYHDG